MKTIQSYLETIANQNSRNANESLIKKMGMFFSKTTSEEIVKNIIECSSEELILFISKECKGKSETTISNTISRIKKTFKYFGNEKAIENLNLMSIKKIINTKNTKYYSPREIEAKIEEVINYQDKALILLTYLGLYDNEFNTMSNLKAENFNKETKELTYNQDGKEKVLKLSDYAAEIVEGAINEEFMEKYIKQDGRKSKPFKLQDNEYIFRSKERAGSLEQVSTASFKKRFKTLKEFLEDDNFNAISIKNSKNIYDLIKYEYDYNYGVDINQLELKEFLKDREQSGTIELLNMSKKEMKPRVIQDIMRGFDKKLFV